MNRIITLAAAIGLLLGAHTAFAADAEKQVNIRPDVPSVVVETADGPVTIERIEDPEHEITGYFAQTSRACPPFCIQPAEAADGVATIGELELLDMLADSEARVIDARTVDWHAEETIPGSVNIPYTEIAGRLDELGCVSNAGAWDCAGAARVALYCNGLWCGQSPTAIRAMLRENYPADRIFYYRGGMQAWKILGLTTVEGGL
ncbi:MAG: rhodanese-like domain-containing protein [Hoeflea sp.]|uniref:rhodanese-like domain-containing protein n=1 Tax=Hoeflea sp. TaxID=1940281 RepID=UPI001D1E31A5|nr:rhodanese-like domain-containing protein [Hoeflea sp.]MBU4528443.1 rhodanese-like domain-containing protein [Alphaproteobacteria bacterium]MBU4543112.1 rhodanese-like domain-containing protein [Alphaproteobacteria bacterium]MBU4551803.1 rhodanese-like domain-containing protein [Alphaproteobacteria bacterium]MBV1723698.1 rhodanese-like domain-containing protein [Hoeflea sp.]MBV1762014.1 rhodanese-like domain-containing protein [Hoeflea sp.]